MKTALLLALAALPACSDPASDVIDVPPPCDPTVPNTICTIVGSGAQGRDGDGRPAIDAEMYVPQDTAMSPDGEVWVLDFNNYLVRAVDANGVIRTVVGAGELGDSPEVGALSTPALEVKSNHVSDLFFHDGYLYLASWHASWVKRVNLSTMMLENYAGAGRRTHYDGDGGPALGASLDLPSSIALAPDGNIVIMDQANQVIRKIDYETGTISRIVGACVIDLDQPCAAGELPQQCPGSDKLACGDLATECEKPCTPSYGGDGGPALEARLGQPYGQSANPAGRLTYDPAGDLIFADTDNHRIRKVDAAGVITTLAGTGEEGYDGDDKPATEAKLTKPIDVVAAPDGTIYFTDMGNNCVRAIDPAGIIHRVVGQCIPGEGAGSFGGDGGPPLDALLDRPYGIDLHGSKLYVSDSYNNRVRLVNLPE